MELTAICSFETREYSSGTFGGVCGSHSHKSKREHSDKSEFSALAREIARAAAEKKKALISERPELDSAHVSENSGGISSDEIKEAIKKIKETASSAAAAPNNANTAENTGFGTVGDPSEEKTQKTLAEMVKEQMEKIDSLFSENKYDKSSDSRLAGIKQKMRWGKKLTPSEQQYLSAKYPDTYSTFQKIDSARRMFRCTLNSCRTKDDVNSMRLSNALTALSEFRKATRGGGSGDDIAGLNAALENELRDFSGTSCFRKLPTVAECNKFDRDLAKARKYEHEKRLEKRRLAAKNKYKKKKKIKIPGDGKRTVAQVLADPTSKKVLASRAKQSYCTCSVGLDISRRMYSKA